MQTRTERDAEDDSDRKVISDVADYGWHVVMIPPEQQTPGWAFSTGMFKTLRHPEIVVFGLDQNVAHFLINEVGRRVQSGVTFGDGAEATGLLESVTCVFRPILPKWYGPFLGTATWYYRGSSFPALQCIWPDHDHHYPWHSEFRRSWLWAQPLLFNESVEDARAADLLATMED